MKSTHSHQSSALAFTLLEVLVSSAVLSVVLAVLLSVLSTCLGVWQVTQGKVEVDSEGRAGALLLMQDVESMVLPTSPSLWPSVVTRGGVPHLRFLTLKPQEYQQGTSASDSENVGDVCFVEYLFSEDAALLRRFYSSKWTYENVLRAGRFPPPSDEGAQLLSTNIVSDLRDSVRGSPLYAEAGRTGFVLLTTNNTGQSGEIMPMLGAPSLSNPPVGLEVNFAVADRSASQNQQLLANPSHRLRNAGYFSVRFDLPKPR